MIADPVFRVVSLTIGMLILGFGWYQVKSAKNSDTGSDDNKLKQKVKKEGIHISVIFAVLYMVIILGLTEYI